MTKENNIEVEDDGLYLDKDNSDLFKDVCYLVEATSEEHHNLWINWHYRPIYNPVPWQQISKGHLLTIGEFHKRPISVLIDYAIIDGKKVMFYTGYSELVDHKMISKWIDKYSPIVRKNTAKQIVWTNSTNFSHCITDLKNMK